MRHNVFLFQFIYGLAPQLQLALHGIAHNLRVVRLPARQALLLRRRLAVHLQEGQQLLQQAVARKLKRHHRTFKALEEVCADQPHHLLLAVVLKGINFLGLAHGPGQWVIHRQRKQWIVSRKRQLKQFQQPPVSLFDGICRHLRCAPFREDCRRTAFPQLALARIGAAALHHQAAKDLTACQHLLRFGHVFPGVRSVIAHRHPKSPLHVVKVRRQVVHPQRARKVGLVPPRKQLGHMAEVSNAVIDGRGSKHEEGLGAHLVRQQIKQPVVARWLAPASHAGHARIAKVMRLINNHHICQFRNALEALREVAFAAQVRMAEYRQVAKVCIATHPANMRQPVTQVWFPHAFARALGRKQHHALALVQHHALNQHQAHKRLAKAHAVAQERAAMLARNLNQRPVRLLLVAVQVLEHARLVLVPLGGRHLMPAKELLQRLGIHIKRRVRLHLPVNCGDDGLAHIAGRVPVQLKPFLQLRHFARTLHLHIQLYVGCKAGLGKVAGAHQRLCAHHLQPRMRDIRLGVKLVLVIHPALNLAGAQRRQDGGHALQKRVGLLVRF